MIGFYFRVSSYKQMKDETIETQKMKAVEWIRKEGLEIGSYQFYKDEAISGKVSIFEREGFKALVNDINLKRIDKVWFYDQSRLMRAEDIEAAQAIAFFRKSKILLYFADNSRTVDLNNSTDKLTFSITTAVDTKVREDIVKKTIDGRKRVRNEGRLAFGHFYGYEKDYRNADGTWVWKPDLEKLSYVRRMYDEILSGNTVRNAYKKVVPVKVLDCGKSELDYWYSRLRRPEYTGYTFGTDGKWIESKIYTEKIVSREEYEKVNDLLEENKKKYRKIFEKGSYTATGIINCFDCNASYYNNSSTVKGNLYEYYVHYNIPNTKCESVRTLHKNKVDMFFDYIYCIEYIHRYFMDDLPFRFQQQYLHATETSNIRLEKEYQVLKEKLEKDIEEYKTQIRKGKIFEEIYEKDLVATHLKVKEINEKLIYLKTTTSDKKLTLQEFIMDKSLDYLKSYLNSNEEDKNYILRKFIKGAVIRKEHLYILTVPLKAYKILVKGFTADALSDIKKYIEFVKNKVSSNDLTKELFNKTVAIEQEYPIVGDDKSVEEIFPDDFENYKKTKEILRDFTRNQR